MTTKWIRQLAVALAAATSLAACAQTPPAKEDPKARLAKAEAMFVERCKKAGVFIHRTAENVESVFLMKLRPSGINYGDQYRMDDPYGRDLDGDGYIISFVRGSYDTMRPKQTKPGWPERRGYRYVEALDEKDGKRYRYTGSMKPVGRKNPNTPNHQIDLARNPNFDLNIYAFVLERVPAPGPAPRYGVTYDDISTREERDYWIAGSSLRVIDLQTNEVMAERIGYMTDRGQGNTFGGRSPWLHAARNACPDFHRFPDPVVVVPSSAAQMRQTQDFVESVLKPIQEK
ncbi:hypothetical protein [Sulfuritalea sp.]|uniref:hypothetical protein n=1 Tax=Sulfuritalea sp. TaxID=2480090 RepID=UPI001AC16857|nr:hypothetical protein [Sulfuritalea sp.]MBN8476932.1 hypothetical protein [Sulfuritalea sp.]